MFYWSTRCALVDEAGTTQLVARAHSITVTNGGSYSQTFEVHVAELKALITVPPMPSSL